MNMTDNNPSQYVCYNDIPTSSKLFQLTDENTYYFRWTFHNAKYDDSALLIYK